MRVVIYQDEPDNLLADADEIQVMICDANDMEEITYIGNQKIVTQTGDPELFTLSGGGVRYWKDGLFLIEVDPRNWIPGDVRIKIRTIKAGNTSEWSNNLLLHKK